MQWRCQREKERKEAGFECNQAPEREAPWEAAVKLTPAAQVDAGRQEQWGDDPGIKGPRLSEASKWSVGVLEYWSIGFQMHYSIATVLRPIKFSTAGRCGNCRVAGRGHIRGTQRLHESDESRYLLRRQVPAKRRHVAAALNHLPDQLVAGEASGHTIQRWAAQTTFAPRAATLPPLLVSHHQRTLQLQRRTSAHRLDGRGIAAPGFHVGRPRGVCPQVSQGTDYQEHENHSQHGHGPPASAFLTGIRKKRGCEQEGNADHWRGEQQESLDVRRQQCQRSINPEEKEIRGRHSVDVSRVRYPSRPLGPEIGGTRENPQYH